MRTSLAATIVFLTLFGVAQSQPAQAQKRADTAKSIGTQNQRQAGKPANKQQPTQPVTVTVTVPPKSPQEMNEERSYRERQMSQQSLQTLFNGLLVIVGLLTCGVVGWQAHETRRSANASERMLLVTNQPRLIVRSIVWKEGTEDSWAHKPYARLHINNTGRSDAIDISENTQCFKWRTLPSENPVHSNMIVISGELTKRIVPGLFQVIDVPIAATPRPTGIDVWEEGGTYYIAGYVYYSDTLKHTHMTVFCYQLNEETRRFTIVNEPGFNYET